MILERRLAEIENRNRRVELDKSWETSKTRKFFVALFTYLSLALYMQAIGIDNPWLNAVIPTFGFFLSTLSLTYIRRVWHKFRH
jgi:hypothetical protein